LGEIEHFGGGVGDCAIVLDSPVPRRCRRVPSEFAVVRLAVSTLDVEAAAAERVDIVHFRRTADVVDDH